MNELSRPGSSQTLRRGLAILRLLAQVGPSGLRVSEIGRHVELNKATAIRLAQALVDERFVSQDVNSGRYRLGPEAFAVGLAAEPTYELQRVCAPLLKELAANSGDTVFFSVRHGYEAICLSRDEGDFHIRNQVLKSGDRYPLGVGAASIALLSAMPDAEIEDALERNAAVRQARYPLCSRRAIWQLVGETRQQGYCLNPGLVTPGSWAIGVPVFDEHNHVVAAMSIAAIEQRLGVVRRTALAQRLAEASAQVTTYLRLRSKA
ncbi:MAG: IclR family transcriptional regulator [Ramlibacter sp.]|nr:IclR family transcriptional regulator [Ramlibacter sp.]